MLKEIHLQIQFCLRHSYLFILNEVTKRIFKHECLRKEAATDDVVAGGAGNALIKTATSPRAAKPNIPFNNFFHFIFYQTWHDRAVPGFLLQSIFQSPTQKRNVNHAKMIRKHRCY